MTRFILALLAPPAYAQPVTVPCQPLPAMEAQLGAGWGEIPVLRGLDSLGRMVVLYVGPQGTFTVIAVEPTMQACVVTWGADVEAVQ